MQHGPPGFPQGPNGLGGIGQPFGMQKDAPPSQSHSRQHSASYDIPTSGPHSQPIARPAPIGRPSSIVHSLHSNDQQSNKADVDDLTNHLGSSALLDDSDEPLGSGIGTRRASVAPGLGRQNFAPAPFGLEPTSYGSPMNSYNTWGAPPNPFGTSSLPGSNYLGWGSVNSSFGNVGVTPTVRSSQPRSVAVRLMICRACKNLEGSTPDGFYDINSIREQLEHLNPPGEQPVSEKELLDICDTEGNAINGGGSFDIRADGNGRHSVRYENDIPPSNHRPVGAPGEIGSPIVGSGGGRFSGAPPGF